MCECEIPLTRRRMVAGMLVALALPATSRRVLGSATDAEHREYMRLALELKREASERGDQPYGAVIVRAGEVVGRGASAVVTSGDPTNHAEMVAIPDACRRLGTRDLSGAVMYGSSRACPMCETAAYEGLLIFRQQRCRRKVNSP